MELNVQNWKKFNVSRTEKQSGLLKIEQCKCGCAGDLKDGNDIYYVGAKKNDNGVMKRVKFDESLVSRGNGIMIICDGQGSVGYSNYMKDAFIGSTTTSIGYDEEINQARAMFIVTCLDLDRYKYSYGRKYRPSMNSAIVKLPVKRNSDGTIVKDETKKYSNEGYIPDWQFMEDYIKSLHHKPITTKVKSGLVKELDVDNWKEFKVSDLFNVKYGINMELNTCIETTSDDPEGIAFVARTAENNGVSAYVKRIEGKEPQPAETITVAGGGSVLSTFVQKRPFYSGRDLYLLIAKEDINLNVKIFISTVLFANQYRYSYGRQANKTLPDLILKLPIKRDSNGNPVIDDNRTYSDSGYIPDWQFMEDYINSLPYSDRI